MTQHLSVEREHQLSPVRVTQHLSVEREHQLSPVRDLAIPNYRGGGKTNAGDRPPHYGKKKRFSFHAVGQDRQILTRSGSGDPELQTRGRRANAGDKPPHYGD